MVKGGGGGVGVGAQLYVSQVFKDIWREVVVSLHSESFKAYEPVGEDSKTKK